MLLETAEHITANHSEEAHSPKSLLNACRSTGVPQLRHVSCRNWIIRVHVQLNLRIYEVLSNIQGAKRLCIETFIIANYEKKSSFEV